MWEQIIWVTISFLVGVYTGREIRTKEYKKMNKENK